MADEDQSQKTEKPTSKKLGQAKDKGQVAQSTEIKSWGMLLASTLGFMMPALMKNVMGTNLKFIAEPHLIPTDLEHLRFVLLELLGDLSIILAPFIGLLFLTAIVINVGQVGLNVSSQKIKPDITKFSPIRGVKKIIGLRSLVEFAKSIAKFIMVSAASLFLVMPILSDLVLLPGFEVIQTLHRLEELTIVLMLGVVGVMTVLAVLDFVYQKYDNTKKLMMSKQEIKDEQKQSDGDPKIKQRLAQIRMERAQQRMMAAVPHADVVITNPTHYAVALQYDMDTMPAPRLIAKGVDEVALRIREVAEENDVAVVENPPIARALYAAVELDEEIPPEHYHAVAEIIGYVFRLKGKISNIAPPAPTAEEQAAQAADETTLH